MIARVWVEKLPSMTSHGDISGSRPRWLAIGLKFIRTPSPLKLCCLLLTTALSVSVYMTFASLETPDVSKVSPVLIHHNQMISSVRAGNTQEENFGVAPHGVAETLESRTTTPGKSNDGDINIDEGGADQVNVQPSNGTTSGSSDRHNDTKAEPAGDASYYDRIGVAPVPCDKDDAISELLSTSPPQFLTDFKNPCWRERLEDPDNLYKNNGFARRSFSYKKALDRFREQFQAKDFSVPQYRLRCLPYFFLAGQPKCGSTDFYNRLVSHPDIVTTPTKEPHWWGKLRFGSIPYSDYLDLFDDAGLNIEAVTEEGNNATAFHPVITGDASVSTLWANDGWWKFGENCGQKEPRYTNAHYIHRFLPGAKILVILRNPTDRLYSDYLYFQTSSKSQEVFHEEVQKSIGYFRECVEDVGVRSCLYNYTIAIKSRVRLRVGLYSLYLAEWLALFPRDQIYVIRLEDYAAAPLTTIKQVYKFLDLRTLSSDQNHQVLEKPKANTRRKEDKKLGRMFPETRTLLDQFYRPFNIKLARILNDDRFLWKR